ncbi:hypothetical protein [Acidisphaera rubrifaciens]|uniref:DUF2125 domain-containing protein n=1 Tax=Acidisphaera rubrifaciens HS-AP3 TaxID=1231350 RepID=A0A0D6P801_9PROT|nr:hypothetical protein [Acidisphaera rubrifaciens]GAN77900.1 hypothetical protein Asru_0503_06 [Acidisphaera rubrifaciens HS-AP3]
MRIGRGLLTGGWSVLLGLALAGAVPAATAGAQPAGGPSQAVLDRAIAGLPAGWSVRYAAASPGEGGALVLKQVVVAHDGRLMLAIGQVTLHGLHGDGSAAAPYAADQLDATSLSGAGPKGVAVAGITATGVAIGPGDAASLPADSRAATTLTALTAVHIDHATLTTVTAGDGRIGRATVDGLAAGRLGRAALDDVALDGGALRVAGLEAEQVDLGWLVRVFDPTAYAPGAAREARAQAVGHLAEHGLVYADGDGTTRIDAFDVTDLQVGQSPSAPVGKGALAIPSAVAAIVMTRLSHTPSKPGGPSFSVGEATLGPWHDGRLDALRVSGIRVAYPKEGRGVDVNAVSLLGLDVHGLIAWAGLPDDRRPDLPPAPRFDSFGVDGVAVTSSAGGPLTVDHIGAQVTWQQQVPVTQDLTVRRLHVPTSLLADQPGAAQALPAFGRDAVDADLEFNMVWDPATHNLRLAPFRIAADGLGTATLDLTFGNVDLALMQQGTDAAVGSLIVATVKGGRLVYQDRSLLGRVLAAVAAVQGTTPEQLRASLLTVLARMKSPLPSVPRLPAILSDFLLHPGTLTVTAKPPAPVPAAMLGAGSLADAAKRLNIGVTTSAP